jgi:glycine oxidase
VTHHDVIVCGAGVIGLSLAVELRKRGLTVLIVERSAPGRESSHAAAGMLAWCESNPALAALTEASYRAYPEFVHEVEDESGLKADLRREGTIQLLDATDPWPTQAGTRALQPAALAELEPHIASSYRAAHLDEASVDPRALSTALERAAKHRNADLVTGSPVLSLELDGSKLTGIRTERATYHAPIVVNCCGAWSAELSGGPRTPTRPRKGQMLSLVGGDLVRHVIRTRDVYLVPRSDGRLLVGATVEDVGFDKRVVPETIQRLHQAAANLIPQLGECKLLEAWAGLRPGTPDDLPILGPTTLPGYFAATGHFRAGILLAPITARIIADLITGATPTFDLTPFNPDRFAPSL